MTTIYYGFVEGAGNRSCPTILTCDVDHMIRIIQDHWNHRGDSSLEDQYGIEYDEDTGTYARRLTHEEYLNALDRVLNHDGDRGECSDNLEDFKAKMIRLFPRWEQEILEMIAEL